MRDEGVIHAQPLGNLQVKWLPGRCPISGKRMFPRKRYAEAQIAEWAKHSEFDGYAYWCKGRRTAAPAVAAGT